MYVQPDYQFRSVMKQGFAVLLVVVAGPNSLDC